MPYSAKITPDERFVWIVIALVCLAALVVLSLLVRNGYLSHVDQAVLGGFHRAKTPALDHFFSAVTWLGSLWVLLPLYLVLVITLSSRHPGLERILGVGFFGAVITTYVIKFLMERKRPHFYPTINELPLDPAFPSAHTTQIIAFCLLLWIVFYNGPSLFGLVLSALLAAVSVSVVLSRMYLQVHYPTDVTAGALIALMWSSIAVLAARTGGSG